MIVSASYRTDIPAFYAEWFRYRLAAGFARARNPYGGPPITISLRSPDVEGFVFWTRNAAPFAVALEDVARLKRPFVVQFTVTGYPRALDARSIVARQAVDQVRCIATSYGRQAVVWRYDPIVCSSLTPFAWHRERFAAIAAELAGSVDEVVVSFVQMYRKTARNLDQAARQANFVVSIPSDTEKAELLAELATIACRHGIRLTLCGPSGVLRPLVAEARCIDAERLARIAGRPLTAARKAHRPGCGCWSSRDIGAYDSCPHGCVYCYAVVSRTAAQRRHRSHDPSAEFAAEVAS